MYFRWQQKDFCEHLHGIPIALLAFRHSPPASLQKRKMRYTLRAEICDLRSLGYSEPLIMQDELYGVTLGFFCFVLFLFFRLSPASSSRNGFWTNKFCLSFCQCNSEQILKKLSFFFFSVNCSLKVSTTLIRFLAGRRRNRLFRVLAETEMRRWIAFSDLREVPFFLSTKTQISLFS